MCYRNHFFVTYHMIKRKKKMDKFCCLIQSRFRNGELLSFGLCSMNLLGFLFSQSSTNLKQLLNSQHLILLQPLEFFFVLIHFNHCFQLVVKSSTLIFKALIPIRFLVLMSRCTFIDSTLTRWLVNISFYCFPSYFALFDFFFLFLFLSLIV